MCSTQRRYFHFLTKGKIGVKMGWVVVGIVVFFLFWSVSYRISLGVTLVVVGFILLMIISKGKACYCLYCCSWLKNEGEIRYIDAILDLHIIQYRIKVYISYNNFNQITTLNYDYKVIQKWSIKETNILKV